MDELLELQKRDTVSKFGTRSSQLTCQPYTPNIDSNKENEDHKKLVMKVIFVFEITADMC